MGWWWRGRNEGGMAQRAVAGGLCVVGRPWCSWCGEPLPRGVLRARADDGWESSWHAHTHRGSFALTSPPSQSMLVWSHLCPARAGPVRVGHARWADRGRSLAGARSLPASGGGRRRRGARGRGDREAHGEELLLLSWAEDADDGSQQQHQRHSRLTADDGRPGGGRLFWMATR